MFPGSSIAIASSAVTIAELRWTVPDPRESIRSLTDCSIAFSGQKPTAQPRSSSIRSGGNRLPERETLVELTRIEDGRDAVLVDRVRAIGLERVRHQIGRELNHSRARVVVPLLVEPHREPVDRLEKRSEQEPDGAGTHYVHQLLGRLQRRPVYSPRIRALEREPRHFAGSRRVIRGCALA